MFNHEILNFDENKKFLHEFFELDFANLLSDNEYYRNKIENKESELIPPLYSKNV